MNLRPLAAFFLLDMKNTYRDRMAIGMLFLFPLFLYVFFGSFFGATNTEESARAYYSNYTISFVAVILLNIAFLNLGPTIVIAKEAGIFRRLMVTPLKVTDLWIASVLRTLLIFLLGYLQMLLAGWLLLGQLPSAPIADLIVPALVSAFTMLSFGFLLGSIYQRPTTAFNAGMLLIQPMLLLSGAGMPLESFPAWAVAVSSLLPFTYVVEIMKLGWAGQYFTEAAIFPTLLLLAMGAGCAALAARLFRRELK